VFKGMDLIPVLGQSKPGTPLKVYLNFVSTHFPRPILQIQDFLLKNTNFPSFLSFYFLDII